MSKQEAPKTEPKAKKKLTRRQIIKRSVLSAVGIGLLGTGWETNQIFVTRHLVTLPGMDPFAKPFRLVQMSDLHRSAFVSEGMIRRAVSLAMAEKPDVIALTGDFVTERSDYIHSCKEALEGLSAPMGVWGILGNHDYAERKQDQVKRVLASMDIDLLVNTSTKLDNGVHLLGVDDLWCGYPDIPKTLAGVPKTAPKIGMIHNPKLADRFMNEEAVLISGHTHGKQINIVGFRAITKMDLKYVAGWYTAGKSKLYVNRGIGVIGIPIRVFSPPEVTVYDFVPPTVG
ncbi:MAG: metallophosphoesterase [Chthonomonadales bacterium]